MREKRICKKCGEIMKNPKSRYQEYCQNCYKENIKNKRKSNINNI